MIQPHSHQHQNILCLGVSYASVEHLPDLKEFSWEHSDLTPRDASAGLRNTIACVRRNLLTQMDGRDLARVVETERVCNVSVYTVSQESGAIYRKDRHYSGNFNNRKFVASLKSQFQGVKFDQVLLDYYWIPAGWNSKHWLRPFFNNTLVTFATLQILNRNAKVFLPFCLQCFTQVLSCKDVILQHYNISFKRLNQLHEIALWRG